MKDRYVLRYTIETDREIELTDEEYERFKSIDWEKRQPVLIEFIQNTGPRAEIVDTYLAPGRTWLGLAHGNE